MLFHSAVGATDLRLRGHRAANADRNRLSPAGLNAATRLVHGRRIRYNRWHQSPSATAHLRAHFSLAAFGQMHGVDAGFLRKLFEQTVKTVLIDGVVLHAFRLLRYLCDQTIQLLG